MKFLRLENRFLFVFNNGNNAFVFDTNQVRSFIAEAFRMLLEDEFWEKL